MKVPEAIVSKGSHADSRLGHDNTPTFNSLNYIGTRA